MTFRLQACVFRRLLTATVAKGTKTTPLPQARTFHKWNNSETYTRRAVPALGLTLAAAGGVYYLGQKLWDSTVDLLVVKADSKPCNIKVASPCKTKKKSRCAEPQPNVVSGLKKYSLFLWITLEPDADPCAVACAAAQVDEAIQATKGFDCDLDDEVLAGVGFGPNFLSQLCLSPCKSFCYRSRKGKRGEMPCSNGDIFVHAKADSMGQLFDFCKTYLKNFPDDSVSEFEDVYGFSFRGQRDISNFLINQTNRCTETGLIEVGVECETGGSYALAQKWVHDLCALDEEQAILECYVGRNMKDRTEVPNRTATSHLTRVTGSAEANAEPKHEIVQQAMSYGTLSDKAGYFFLAFARDPCVFDWMLDRMTGQGCDDKESDDIMRLSKNVKGSYWYFPGCKEIEEMKSGCS